MGRLRGYGNAIVPQVAATFVKAFMDSVLRKETDDAEEAREGTSLWEGPEF
jgi:hypothetical protein